MMKKIVDFVKDNKIIEHSDSVVLGVSGGADSMCMMYALNSLRGNMKLKLHVVHINHGIRGEEADRDALYVKEECDKLGLPFLLEKTDVPEIVRQTGKSEEEAGREVRYKIFYKVAENVGANKIAVAHNLNDNSETILFNLFRGTGIKGLTGIPLQRDIIVRPLLCCTRKEIEDYLSKNNITYITDSTNTMTEYSRNKLRLDVLPYIKENINEKAEYNIVNAADNLREIYDFILKETDRAYDKYVKDDVLLSDCVCLHNAVLSELIRRVIFEKTGKLKDITRVHIDTVRKLFDLSVSKRAELPYNLVAERTYKGILIKKRTNLSDKSSQFAQKTLIENKHIYSDQIINIVKEDKDFGKDRIKELLYTKWFDYDKIEKLVLRTRNQGDYIVIDDCGRKKKLKEFFINEKISREERDNILLLADGNSIVWIVGYRISAYYKVTDKTKNIIKITYDKEKKNDS